MSNLVKQQKVKWKSYCENNELRDFEFGLVISKLGLAKNWVFFLIRAIQTAKRKKIASYSLFVYCCFVLFLFAVEMRVWYLLEKLHILFRWWRNRMIFVKIFQALCTNILIAFLLLLAAILYYRKKC